MIEENKQQSMEKAWHDFVEFTNTKQTTDNFDLFACGYMRGRSDQLEKSLKVLQDGYFDLDVQQLADAVRQADQDATQQ